MEVSNIWDLVQTMIYIIPVLTFSYFLGRLSHQVKINTEDMKQLKDTYGKDLDDIEKQHVLSFNKLEKAIDSLQKDVQALAVAVAVLTEKITKEEK